VNRWVLFWVMFWTVPFPLFGLEGLAVPAARFVQLAASLSVLVALEGAGGMVGAMLALLCVHSLIYSMILYLGSVVVERWVAPRFSTHAGRWLLAGLAIVLVTWGLLGTPYDTSFHHSDPHASLIGLYR
jgi:hypothetical protein